MIHVNDVRPDKRELEAELSNGEFDERRVLGCAVKFSLDEITGYIERVNGRFTYLRFGPQQDLAVIPSNGNYSLNRALVHLGNGSMDLRGFQGVLDTANPTAMVGLLALLSNYHFEEKVDPLYQGIENILRKRESRLLFGKAHTIATRPEQGDESKGTYVQPESEFAVFDLLTTTQGDLHLVGNNDTISHIDSFVGGSSWVTTFVGLNNAMTDLNSSGVSQVTLYPTVAGRTEKEAKEILQNLERYEQMFRQYGITVNFDAKPISLDGKPGPVMNGATAIGITDRELPSADNLEEGLVLIATRPIGDLAVLTQYGVDTFTAKAYQEYGQPDKAQRVLASRDSYAGLRAEILHLLTTPNIPAAEVIRNNLPKKGERFGYEHILATTDITGPGLGVLPLYFFREHDIHLGEPVYHSPLIPKMTAAPDVTAGTNGSIILAVHPNKADEIMKQLEAVGLNPWELGYVGKRSEKPAIYYSGARDLLPEQNISPRLQKCLNYSSG